MLEHHADPGPLPGDRGVSQLVQAATVVAVADQLAVELHEPGVRAFQVVEAAQQGALAGAGRAEQDHHLAGGHVEVDAVEDPVRAETLGEAPHVDQRRAHSARRQRSSVTRRVPRP